MITQKFRNVSFKNIKDRAQYRVYLVFLAWLLCFTGAIGWTLLPSDAVALSRLEKLLIVAETELYSDNRGEGKPIGALAPFQSVKLIKMDAADSAFEYPKWYMVRTWLGDKWIKADNRVMNGTFHKVDLNITSVYEVHLYDRPDFDALTPYKVSPQKLHVTAKIPYELLHIESALEALTSGGSWYRIKTWLGDKWIVNPSLLEDVAEKPVSYSIKLTGEENTYPYPYIVESTALKIEPKAVKVTATWESGFGPWSMLWYKVELPEGQRWVSPMNPVIPDYREVNETLTLPTETRHFPSPQLDIEGKDWLDPGTYEAFEVSGDWKHIRLPQGGEAWVNPARALLERPVGIVKTDEKIELTKETETFRYPLTGEQAHARGFYKPQSVQAFEKWVSDDGSTWYHFHGYGLDEWVKQSSVVRD